MKKRNNPTTTVEDIVAAINKGRGQRPPISVESFLEWLHGDEHDDVCSNPKSLNFMKGASVARKVAILKRQSSAKYNALDELLTAVLRDEFLKIGPDPGTASRG
jgi:hypothetical protein